MNIVVRSLALGLTACLSAVAIGDEAQPPASDEPRPVPLADVVQTMLPQWLRAADDALKSGAIETADEPMFLELARLVEVLKRDKTLLAVDRQKALDAARPRLLRGHELLRKQVARTSRTVVYAQPLPGQPGTPTQTSGTSLNVQGARQLIDVITAVLRPETWEDRGGQGTIRYWSLGHALVIYQSSDVHEQIGGTLGAMR